MDERDSEIKASSIDEAPDNIFNDQINRLICLRFMLLKLGQLINEEFDNKVSEVDKDR